MSATTRLDGPRPATVSRRTDALVASVAQHHKAISAHQHQLLTTIAELDRRRAWRVDGATSIVAWLVQRCGVNASTARDWVTAAQRLTNLPEISNALASGKLSFDQVRPLVDVARPQTDADLAEKATHWSAKQVRELAIAHRRQSDDQAAGHFTRRFLRFNDRRRTFAGALPEDQYAMVKNELTTRASRPVRGGAPFEQRIADALVEMCGSDGARAPGGAGADSNANGTPIKKRRPLVVVHADFSLLAGGQGEAELDVLGPISCEAARRLACDAHIILSADDAEGHSIQQGPAHRDATRAQRIEIRRRDKGCRFPGCTYTDFTDVHHVVHWSNGGPTDIPNLVTLCDPHHRAVHELGWTMSGNANVELTFRSPTGRITTSTPSPTFKPARAGPPG
jgi:hypothetical protein